MNNFGGLTEGCKLHLKHLTGLMAGDVGRLGRGTMNLPSESREWLASKWLRRIRSSGVRELLATVFSSTSQKWFSRSSPVSIDTWYEGTMSEPSVPVLPARTQPNTVSVAVGEPGRPLRRP